MCTLIFENTGLVPTISLSSLFPFENAFFPNCHVFRKASPFLPPEAGQSKNLVCLVLVKFLNE